ncbi:sugar phosphate isomerase/epimerase [Galbibacter sp. EGI 63066]|uniref:sugar phosphate isomerase/epimerase family protein n=1 Tax=Galbibacter sp. EGI 63066 TaxID=2993559 RepID=UPI00224939EC|nr:sugar phosphate isomerase/epimerase family protein [Galbibacter sp. EGI 63066]MCX2680480.1 sugar phosphate isomerase/epimerase [Galbibacter sp. EGI 63066]
MKRRQFVNATAKTGLALSFLGVMACKEQKRKTTEEIVADIEADAPLFFKLSLAQWSLHRALKSGAMDNLDFAAKAKNLGCEGLEYVNQFFADKAEDKAYLDQMNDRASSEGMENVLIMIDGEGQLADPDTKKRIQAIENHYKWVEAAKYLGCHAIRVNLAGGEEMEEASKAGADSLSKLSEFASQHDINILVENHGGFSSNGAWLGGVMKEVGLDNCGTLPDFGNFCIEHGPDYSCLKEYDRYKGVKEMLPYAKAVSAKSHDFDAEGNETHTDYLKMMKMVKDSGYTGFVGIEYEGNEASEEKGIELTRDLLIKVGKELG